MVADDSDAQHRFTMLFEATYGQVLAYVSRRVPADRADDLLAHVYLTAWEHMDALPPEPLPWLYRAAWNAVGNDRRAASRGLRLRQRLSNESSTVPPTRDPGEQVASVDRIRTALQGLPDNDREAIRLVCWEQLSVSDAAAVLNCTPSALSVRLHRARTKLAAQLDANDATDSPTELGAILARKQTT